MSFPCGLEHLRRCAGSTRWWSVDWHLCHRGTLALLISLGRFRLIGTYNQFFIPRNQVSHIRICFASPLPCAIADLQLYSKPFNTHQTLTPSTCLYSLPLLTLHYDYPFSLSLWCYCSTTLSSEYNPPRTRHDLYTPTLLFFGQSRSSLSRVWENCVRFIPITFNPP